MKSKSVHNKVAPNQLGTFNVNRFIYQGFNRPKATPKNKSKSVGQLKGSMTSRKWKKIKRENEKRPKAARDVFRAVLY